MSSLQYEAPLPFDYRVVRSRRRRTAAIQIKGNLVEVRVPHWVTDDWVSGFVRERQAWVAQRLSIVVAQRDRHRLEVQDGASLPYRGGWIRLHWQPGAASGCELSGDTLIVGLSRRIRRPEATVAEEQVRGWLLDRAGEALPARLRHLASQTGLAPAGVAVRGFRRRWGSCDNRGRIALNWRLVLAEPGAADYVLIHELCHLRHFDHSPRFWQLVAQHCPDHRYWQDYLRERSCWLEW
ncbi:MAG: M48 family metallopeptidase [Oceanospirillaceae bacterium]|nr:M48 family metallopeptidase [Oceanospirillaceae bacterium]